jgi:hypothetical protein
MDKDLIHYEFRYTNTLEAVDFITDDNGNLLYYSVDVIVQPSPIIEFDELFQKVFNEHMKKYILIFGDPSNGDKKTATYVWKYEDATAIFWPYKHEVYPRMKLLCAPNDIIAEALGQ